MITETITTLQIARYSIAFSWLYHGLAPKLIHIAPHEKLMSDSLGFDPEFTYLFIKAAGMAEVVWAIIFFYAYRVAAILWLNIVALTGLLLAVAVLQPTYGSRHLTQ